MSYLEAVQNKLKNTHYGITMYLRVNIVDNREDVYDILFLEGLLVLVVHCVVPEQDLNPSFLGEQPEHGHLLQAVLFHSRVYTITVNKRCNCYYNVFYVTIVTIQSYNTNYRFNNLSLILPCLLK